MLVRAALTLAYRPGFVGSEDAFTYLALSWRSNFVDTVPDRPSGYPVFIELVSVLGHNVAVLVSVQHLCGLALAVVAYAMLLRAGSSRGVALAMAAVLALDSYLVTAEHWVLTEAVATALVFAALALTAASRRPWALALAGLLLGAAIPVRTATVFVVPAWAAYVLWQRRTWRMAVPALVALAVLPLAHATFYEHRTGKFGMTRMEGWFLYARVAKIGTCGGAHIPERAKPMCPLLQTPPPDARTALWGGARSPAHRVFGGPTTEGLSADPILRDYAFAIVRARPLVYARMVGRDMLRYFDPRLAELGVMQLSAQPASIPPSHATATKNLIPGVDQRRRAPAEVLDVYGDVVHIPRFLLGPGAALAALLAALAIAGPGRRWVPRRAEALLFLLGGWGIVLGSTATSGYIWRYLVPALPLLVCGTLLVAEDVVRGARTRRSTRSRLATAVE